MAATGVGVRGSGCRFEVTLEQVDHHGVGVGVGAEKFFCGEFDVVSGFGSSVSATVSDGVGERPLVGGAMTDDPGSSAADRRHTDVTGEVVVTNADGVTDGEDVVVGACRSSLRCSR